MYLNDAKCRLNISKVLTQSITWAVRTNANFRERVVNCYCYYYLHSSGIFFKNQTLSRVCYFIEYKDFPVVREVRRLLKTWTKVVTCRFSQQSSIENKATVERVTLLETKQRPFRFDESRRNQELSRWIETQQSRIESWFSLWFSIQFNLLLNGTVYKLPD